MRLLVYIQKLIVTIPLILLVFCVGLVAAAERLTVAVPSANIRSGPGTKYDVLWKVSKFFPLQVIQSSGKWYRFKDFEGDEGWIHKSLVRKIPAVVTKRDNCNVRSGPDTSFNIVFTTEKGVPLKVVERKEKWLLVQHADGDKGWIHTSLVW
jgi:SH3-like domain-containing protein